MMTVATRLEPISAERASAIAAMLRQAHEDSSKAVALDENGRPTGVVEVDDPREQHLLGDLDVHA